MSNNSIKVLVVKPGEYPTVKEIAHNLDSIQNTVGGYFETVHPFEDDNTVLVCNDSALIEGLPLNRQINEYTVIAGTFFICADAEETFASLSEEQIRHYEKLFHAPELFFRAPGTAMGVKAVTCTPAEYHFMMDN